MQVEHDVAAALRAVTRAEHDRAFHPVPTPCASEQRHRAPMIGALAALREMKKAR
jgi:hypothetical protein